MTISPLRVWRTLIDEWNATEQPLKERGSVLPLGTYEDGSTHFAWPSIMATPVESWGKLSAMDPNVMLSDDETLKYASGLGADVAGGAMTGGFAVGAAGGAPRNALMSNAPSGLKKLADDGITAYHGSPYDFDEFKTPAFFAPTERHARAYKNQGGGFDNLNGLGGREQQRGYTQASEAMDLTAHDRARALGYLKGRIAAYEQPRSKGLWERLTGRVSEHDASTDRTDAHLADWVREGAEYLESGQPMGRMYEVRVPKPEKDYSHVGDRALNQAEAIADATREGHKVISFYNGEEIVALDPAAIEIVRKFYANANPSLPLAMEGAGNGDDRERLLRIFLGMEGAQ